MTPDDSSEMDLPKLKQLAQAIENTSVDETVRIDEKRTPIDFVQKDIEAPISWENCDFETAISATGL